MVFAALKQVVAGYNQGEGFAESVVISNNEVSPAGKVIAASTTGFPGVCRAVVNDYKPYSGKVRSVVKHAMPLPQPDRALFPDTMG